MNTSSKNFQAVGLEELFDFLTKAGVNPKYTGAEDYGFSRVIEFKVYDITYRCIWFKNETTLRIGLGERAACIPFRYIFIDDCFPLVGGNLSIGFSYTKNERASILDREYPYEVFRIPLEA
jgi:hypothetical protein